MIPWATLAFWCIEIDPGGAPTTGARMSPSDRPISHQPSDHARTPRVIQLSANACTWSTARRGIAPSEWLTR